MNDLALTTNTIVRMTPEAIDKVRAFEKRVLEMPQAEIPTHHVLHGGMYSRTIMIPAGTTLTGAFIKIATTLILQGNAIVYVGGEPKQLRGYNVLAASANRKQAFVAVEDTYLTMIFPTQARTVLEAEEEFTDEAHRLMSREKDAANSIMITGE